MPDSTSSAPPGRPADTSSDHPAEASSDSGGVSRRSFIQTLGVSAAAGAWARREQAAAARPDADDPDADDLETFGPGAQHITLSVNGQPLRTQVEPQTTLMEALRWHLELTGTKECCDRGACGACSVLVDGRLINSCMMLAADARDAEVMTIEGFAGDNGDLTAVQEAFIKHDALQCGYCTPGLIVATHALLARHHQPTLDQIKAGLSGNLCRCGAYTNIFNAVLDASGQSPIADPNNGGV